MARALTRLRRSPDGFEDPQQDGRHKRGRVLGRQLAPELDGDLADLAAGDLPQELAEDRREPEVRGQPLADLRVGERCIHRAARRAAGQDLEHVVGGLDCHPDLRLGRRRAEMRCEQDPRGLEERRADGRLAMEDVDGRSGDPAGAERIGEGGLVDDLAARRVDQEGRRPHQPELGDADHAPGGSRQRHVQADDIGIGEQPGQVDELDADGWPLPRR